MIKQLLSMFVESSNSFQGQKEGETVILLLRKHPFIIITRLSLFFLAALIPIVGGILTWSYLTEDENLKNLFFFSSTIWYLVLWLTSFYSLTLYSLDNVIITNHRIIKSYQHSLFNREIAELHSHRIQDVTTHTNGIIQTFLEFGDITIQTAGTENQFMFKQIPNPDEVKDVIMHITASKHSGVISASAGQTRPN